MHATTPRATEASRTASYSIPTGVQYAAKEFAHILSFNRKTEQSMSRKGNCWDNAVAESFFSTIKYEKPNHHRFGSFEQVGRCVNEYIRWYNTKRLHSVLGYGTPLEREVIILG